jgi:hypothetical protein
MSDNRYYVNDDERSPPGLLALGLTQGLPGFARLGVGVTRLYVCFPCGSSLGAQPPIV